MPLPNFLNKIFQKKHEETEYYLALEIKQHYVKAAVWNKTADISSLIGTGEKEAGENWDEVINAADEAISAAAGLLDQSKINKTIFGLKESWIVEGKIKKEILGNLKKLCSELTLTPLGFVTNTESVLSYIQKNEGTRLTAILLDINTKEIALSVIRVGKISNTKIWDRSEKSLSEEISAVLKSFTDEEVLPSRIILYDGRSDLEAVRQELINFPWTQKASFLHFPKIEILPDKADLEGLVYAGSTELGSQLISDRAPVLAPEPKSPVAPLPAGASPVSPSPLTVSLPAPLPVVKNDPLLGFVEEKDILEVNQPVINETLPAAPNITIPPAASGIPFHDKPLMEPVIITRPPPKIENPVSEKPAPSSLPPSGLSSAPVDTVPAAKLNFSGLIPDLSGLFDFLPGKVFLIIGLVLVLGLGAGGIWAIGQFSHAAVKIYVQPEILEQEADIVVNPEAKTVDSSINEIPAKLLQIDESDSLKKPATGKKTVGDKAKGAVTLYNKTTTGSKTFSSGTILNGPDNKQFTLDGDVTIPVASSDLEGITFGKIKANVTAIDIGSDYNLSSGQKEFTIKEYPSSSYSGAADAAFTGGSSRQIKIVTDDDKKQLLSDLTSKLRDKARQDLRTKLDTGDELITESFEKVSDAPKYSADTGDEANDLTLDDKVKFKVYAYNYRDIKEILKEVIKKAATSEYEFNDAKTEITVKNKEDLTGEDGKKKGAIRLKIAYKTTLMPKIDKEALIKNISGRNQEIATGYVKSLPNVVSFEANVSPKLPAPFFVFPRNPANIKLEIIPKT